VKGRFGPVEGKAVVSYLKIRLDLFICQYHPHISHHPALGMKPTNNQTLLIVFVVVGFVLLDHVRYPSSLSPLPSPQNTNIGIEAALHTSLRAAATQQGSKYGPDQVAPACMRLNEKYGIGQGYLSPRIDDYEDAKDWIMFR
jgi:hypothetical protein